MPPVCTLHRGGTAGGKNPKGKPPGPLGKAALSAGKKATIAGAITYGRPGYSPDPKNRPGCDAEAGGLPQRPQRPLSTGRGVLPLLEKAAAGDFEEERMGMHDVGVWASWILKASPTTLARTLALPHFSQLMVRL